MESNKDKSNTIDNDGNNKAIRKTGTVLSIPRGTSVVGAQQPITMSPSTTTTATTTTQKSNTTVPSTPPQPPTTGIKETTPLENNGGDVVMHPKTTTTDELISDQPNIRKKGRGRPSLKQIVANLNTNTSIHLKQIITNKTTEQSKENKKRSEEEELHQQLLEDSDIDQKMVDESDHSVNNDRLDEDEYDDASDTSKTAKVTSTTTSSITPNPRGARKAKETAVIKSQQLIVVPKKRNILPSTNANNNNINNNNNNNNNTDDENEEQDKHNESDETSPTKKDDIDQDMDDDMSISSHQDIKPTTNTTTTLAVAPVLEVKRKKYAKTSDIGPCWTEGCVKSDRTLKHLRPLNISTCRTHALKTEGKLIDAIKRGDFCPDEMPNAKKDTVCGLCGDTLTDQPNYPCSNSECAFSFCGSCSDTISDLHDNSPKDTGRDLSQWECWVCEAVKIKGKERERSKWLKMNTPTSIYQQPIKKPPKAPSTPNTTSNAKQPTTSPIIHQPMTPSSFQNVNNTPINNNNIPAQLGKRVRKFREGFNPLNPDQPLPTTTTTTTTTTKPNKPDQLQKKLKTNNNNTTMINNNNNGGKSESMTSFEYFIEQALNTASFISGIVDPPPSKEASRTIAILYDLIMKIKDIKFKNNYSLLWVMLEELSNVVKTNLTVAKHIAMMEDEIISTDNNDLSNATSIARNVPLERAITKVFENHEQTNFIAREYYSTRNTLQSSMDLAYISIQELAKDYELARTLHSIREANINNEIVQLDKQIKFYLDDIDLLHTQERSLLESLSKIRSGIKECDMKRDNIEIKTQSLKLDVLKSKNKLFSCEKDFKTKQTVLENEITALTLLIKIIETIYWVHHHYYEHLFQKTERALCHRVNSIQSKLKAKGQFMIWADPISFDTLKTIGLYHPACLSTHQVPEGDTDTPSRLSVPISLLKKFEREYPIKFDVLSEINDVDRRFLMSVHDPLYIKQLEKSIPKSQPSNITTEQQQQTEQPQQPQQPKFVNIDDDVDHKTQKQYSNYATYISEKSLEAAYKAAGVVCAAVDAVARCGFTNAFCAIRPPGHHAGRYGRTPDAPTQGLCLINNVAIGAKYASMTVGFTRIAVVDFDAHHGNGTQEILAADDNYLFISLHAAYDDYKKPVFPGTGREPQPSGLSNVLNIPFKRGTSSVVYMAEFTEKVIPRLHQYQPQLIFISAGFNGHKDDPTQALKLTEDDYFQMTKMIKDVAIRYSKGRIISVLEGGYGLGDENNNCLYKSINAHLKALVEDTPEQQTLELSCFSAFEDVNFLNQKNAAFANENIVSNHPIISTATTPTTTTTTTTTSTNSTTK